MRLFLLRFLAVTITLSGISYGGYHFYQLRHPADSLAAARPAVLGVADTIANMIFRVAIPARFEDTVTFAQPISAPNLLLSLKAGTGIALTSGQDPTISLSLLGGTGITIDGNKITNAGIVSLTAGDGISVDGSTITNTGILSLEAGTGISVDGNTITNTMEDPDYTLAGWTNGTDVIYLTTLTDKVGIGTTTPTSSLHVVGSSNLTGAVTLGTTSSDAITINGAISAGSSIIPANDLGSDLGSSSKRFNNIWAANVNSNSSQSFSGQTTFSYAPTSDTISTGSVLINPTTSYANGQLLGLGIAGYQRALIDANGNLVVSYNGLTSAPVTGDPLTVYDHGTTRVHIVDDVGNGYFAGKLGVGIDATNTSINGLFEVHKDQNTGTYSTVTNYNNTASAIAGFYADNATTRLWMEAYSPSAGGIYNNAGYIHTNASNQPLYFGNSGVALALITDKVGIGTTGPDRVLDVLDASSPQLRLTQTDSTTYADFQVNSSGDLVEGVDGTTDQLVLDNGGSVGIGTNAPSAKLHISGALGSLGIKVDSTDNSGILIRKAAASNSASLYFRLTDNTQHWELGTLGDVNFAIKDSQATTTPFKIISGTSLADTLVLKAGSVGIGTATPGYPLTISAVGGDSSTDFGGDLIKATGTGTQKAAFIAIGNTTHGFKLGINGNGSGGIANSFVIRDESLNLDRLFIASTNGNVGIGTSSPVSLLHLSGAVTGKALAILDETGDQNIFTASASGVTRATISRAGRIDLNVTSPGGTGLAIKYGDPAVGLELTPSAEFYSMYTNTFDFRQNASPYTTRLFISGSSSAVGIGTVSPEGQLHIWGGTAGTVTASTTYNELVLEDDDHAGMSILNPDNKLGRVVFGSPSDNFGATVYWDYTNSLMKVSPAKVGASLSLGYGDESDAVRIDSAGKVGIGTTSPTSLLHTSGNVTGKALTIFDETGDQDIFTASASGSPLFTIKHDGKVGVGTTAPAAPLQVQKNSVANVSTDGLALQNDTAAALGAQQWSPRLRFTGKGWQTTGSTSNTVDGVIELKTGQGSTNNNTSKLAFSVTQNGTLTEVASIDGNGGFTTFSTIVNGGNLTMNSAYAVAWNADAYLSRNAAGVVQVGTGVNALGTLTAAKVGLGTASPSTKLHISGATTGKALAMFDETGDQALFTASSSGTAKFTILHNGLTDARTGIATYTKAGTISDTDFTDAAVDGLLGFDSTDGRLYVRNGGAWSYIAKTAGFQIPDYESVGLVAGDYLVPYVEKKMSDGAVHGLYAKWSDVKNTLLAEVTSKIVNLESAITAFADTFKTKEICLTGDNNTQTCIKKDQLDELVKLIPSPSPTSSTSPSPTPTPIPSTVPSPEPSQTATPSATMSP